MNQLRDGARHPIHERYLEQIGLGSAFCHTNYRIVLHAANHHGHTNFQFVLHVL